MSTIFHEGRKILRLSLNGNHNLAEIADLLYFRIDGSKYTDHHGQFFLLPNIEHISDNTGFGKTTCIKALKELEKLGFIKKLKKRCYDNAVRIRIYLTKKFKKLMADIANLKNYDLKAEPKKAQPVIEKDVNNTNNIDAIKTKETDSLLPEITSKTISYADSPNFDKSDSPDFDESIIKEESKKNNIIKNVTSCEKEKIVELIDYKNTPEFTKDKNISEDITDNQINAIDQVSKDYDIDPSKIFQTVMKLIHTKVDLFNDYNEILAVAINQQLMPIVDAREFEEEKAKCKYEIDYRATDLANDERFEILDNTQVYAIENNLKYLQKHLNKQFDFDELKGWVSHSLLHGYSGIGFKKAIRCIVKAIRENKYTRPFALRTQYR